ncbi:rab GTPase-binding effector protein 1-like [Tigriopus californicus]|uniref:rab GTPase-binding effector protein 1-like n=1 Tax=Tigriopus californicus TaxID=6832 RepID=UPI0027DA535C|nr:rab GTPase-binding effector protein 1-like [Tigriopus californicus]
MEATVDDQLSLINLESPSSPESPETEMEHVQTESEAISLDESPEAVLGTDATPEATIQSLTLKVEALERTLDESKSEVAVAECLKDSVIHLERVKKSQDEELATLQQLLNEAHDEASSNRTRFEHELAKIRAIKNQLEHENHELKISLKLGRGGSVSAAMGQVGVSDGSVLDKETISQISDATRSFARRMRSNIQTAVIRPSSSKPELDDNMKRAYEDTELLKSIVVPLEEQINALKDKLRETDSLLREQESRQGQTLLGVEAMAQWLSGRSLEEAMAGLVEKSNDPDLLSTRDRLKEDLYVGLLSTRYSLLNSELAGLRREHAETVELLSKERSCTKKLRQESVINSSDLVRLQREHLGEVTRLQAVLSEEQMREIMKPQSPATHLNDNSAISTLPEDSSPAETIGVSDLDVKPPPLDTSNSNSTSNSSVDSSPVHDNVSGKSDDSLNMARIVSSVEWDDMQKELSKVRALLGVGAGDSVVGSDQYRELQKELIELKKQKAVLAKSEAKSKQDLQNEAAFRREAEQLWNERSEFHKTETEGLTQRIQELEGLLEQVQLRYNTTHESTRKDLLSLTTDREKIVRELKRLQDEVDLLVGKHHSRAEEMQNEMINLPEKTEDMHLLLLKYGEDLITTKVAKERLEERMRSEVAFLKSQIIGEQQAKESIEDQLNTENDALKEELSKHQKCKKELEREKLRRREMEGDQERQIQTQAHLQTQMEAHLKEKQNLERQLLEMKNKIRNLQQELDNTVAVQTDFVRLSQSLQMELEKIRQSEKEVRWQHEDDVDACQTCKISLNATKRKHHCRHCGKIFCSECVRKSVPSGPKQRLCKVCDVCHTLLNQNSAPYFSTEAPQVS